MANDKKTKQLILYFLQGASEKGRTRTELRKLIGNCDAKYFRRLFQELVKEGKIASVSRNRFRLVAEPEANFIKGRLQVNSQGFGFVTPLKKSDSAQDIFIPPGKLSNAIAGDIVKVKILEEGDSRGPSGVVDSILKREHNDIVGCLVKHGQGWAIRPLRRELPALIWLTNDNQKVLSCCKEGDWVQVELAKDSQQSSELQATIKTRISASGTVTADLNAISKEFSLPNKYSAKAEERARELTALELPREDWQELLAVTIDPVDAKDYDDALSLIEGPEKNLLTLAVHIADVACYVPAGSYFDKTAKKRGFTSYLPGRTLAMLPTALANDLCSLREGETRQAHTVFMQVDKNSGKVISARRARTLIKVDKRLCYDEVSRFFDGDKVDIPKNIGEMLNKLHQLTTAMQRYRAKFEKFLPMDMPEIRVLCSEKPSRVVGMQRMEQDSANYLIEEAMLAANQAIAEEMLSKKIPGIYRNHADPEEDSLLEFSDQMSRFFDINSKSLRSRSRLIKLIRQINNHPLSDLLQMMFLRSLQRAEYSAKNLGHYGLGKEKYCHFTSPIRRYPDLFIHQQLLAYDLKKKILNPEKTAELAVTCTNLEENVDQASFAAADRMKLRFIIKQEEDNPMLRIRGFITRTAKSGLTVFLPDYSLIAFVNAWQMPKKDWRFRGDKQMWRNMNTGESLMVGQEAEFLVNTVDPIRGELTLTPLFRKK